MSSLVLVFARLVLGASLLVTPQSSRPVVPDTLYAAHYRPGLMEKVAERRRMSQVPCMISSPWHSLNVWMSVKSERNGEMAICRTTDVSSPRDIAWHRRLQLIELDWNTATRLCAISRVAQRPPRACPVKIDVISEEVAMLALGVVPADQTAAPAPPPDQPASTAPTTDTAALTDTTQLVPAPTTPTTDTAAITNTAVLTP